jgi:hypothetical protein
VFAESSFLKSELDPTEHESGLLDSLGTSNALSLASPQNVQSASIGNTNLVGDILKATLGDFMLSRKQGLALSAASFLNDREKKVLGLSRFVLSGLLTLSSGGVHGALNLEA